MRNRAQAAAAAAGATAALVWAEAGLRSTAQAATSPGAAVDQIKLGNVIIRAFLLRV